MIERTLEQELAERGSVLRTTTGDSMRPMLRERETLVELRRPAEALRRYDLPLYRREDGAYVLHRILRVKGDGYLICGDNQRRCEWIPRSAVVGVVTRFYRNGAWHSTDEWRYRCYVHLWCDFFFIRALVLRLRELLSAAKRPKDDSKERSREKATGSGCAPLDNQNDR